jgi:hypothetical protein
MTVPSPVDVRETLPPAMAVFPSLPEVPIPLESERDPPDAPDPDLISTLPPAEFEADPAAKLKSPTIPSRPETSPDVSFRAPEDPVVLRPVVMPISPEEEAENSVWMETDPLGPD